ncbi:MAG: hypothetical protein M0Q49_06400 [Porticoccaceae bacterium]|nr:hypothetical protein [Porticoccaceae bacterium]
MNLDEPVTQVEFAALVGVSKQAVSAHLKNSILNEGETARQWLIAYCERLRLEAAGRVPSDARERRDLAAARKDEVQAALAERELYRQDSLILDIDSVRQAMTEWITLGKNEFLGAVDRMVTAIESDHGITIDRETLQPDIDAALRAIGDYQFESDATGDGDSAAMAPAA